MSTSLLYHAFGIRGYRYAATDYRDGESIVRIGAPRESLRCARCGSPRVHVIERFRQLREENARLRRENAQLRRRIEQLGGTGSSKRPAESYSLRAEEQRRKQASDSGEKKKQRRQKGRKGDAALF